MRLGLTAFVSLLISVPLLGAEVDDTLVLYLPFDEGEGKVVSDLSIYGNDGEIKGDPKWVDGKFGKALYFDGTDDWVQVPDSPSLRVKEAVTVMAWIKAERHTFPGTNWQGIVAKSNSPRSYSFYTEVSGGLHFSTSAAAPQPFYGSVSTAKVPLKEWVHVAVVAETSKNGGWHRYYVNGEPGGERFFAELTTLPGDSDAQDVLIGRTWEDSRFFLGAIDEVRIWNRALSEEEIKEQMRMGASDFLALQVAGKLPAMWGYLKSR